MDTEIAIVLSTAIYKLASLGVGMICCVLGYKLFVAGIWGPAGDLTAKFQDMRLILKSAAPGTFFVVLGTFIVLFTLYQGIHFNLLDSEKGKSIDNKKATHKEDTTKKRLPELP